MSRIRTLGIHEQSAWVRSRFPGFQCTIEAGLLVCRGRIQPSPMCSTYDVEVHYRTGTWPKAFVLDPKLQPLEPGGRIPHSYGNARPCLFYPSRHAWRSDMKLADTVIPWLSLWMAFYEMWHATGEWYGGGISHGPIEEIEPAA
jgi:hypothetical protein